MKSSMLTYGLLAGASCWLLIGPAAVAFAQDEAPAKPEQRLDRMEHRINELAEHQQRLMHRMDAEPAPGTPLPGPDRFLAPTPSSPAYLPIFDRVAHHAHDLLCLGILWCLVCNVLMAVWIATDIRKRGEGSGIFIALAIFAGIPAAIIYSLTRIGDKPAATAK